eukprot:CAMPEP_0115328318 /NCGR_PEP_ID=MMETSP0270-20121206/84617_1 /TAXON_ID=71861 /ORGANISM="Scrippsiella trochoidea, Strain CCMP3099" /LENGTH=69 /DNA_ID=CAMNT_0002748833 /DNA_START=34 /DNA_END=240 /DNA_ORIENTATION=-
MIGKVATRMPLRTHPTKCQKRTLQAHPAINKRRATTTDVSPPVRNSRSPAWRMTRISVHLYTHSSTNSG